MMKDIRYLMEAAIIWLAFLVFRLMPVQTASATGAWIGRTLGPRLGASNKARVNLEKAFPEKPASEIDAIVAGMWDNLGRVAAEYPHLKEIVMNRCEIVGREHLDALGRDDQFVAIGGHLANWELLPFYFNYKIDWPIVGMYRAPNNPYAEYMLDRCRNPEKRGTYIAKSQKGAREMVAIMKQGERLMILIDQKYNQGIAADFFGRPAMTSSAFAQLAAKYDCPIIPIQAERLPNCRFRLTIHPPFKTEGLTSEAIIAKAHGILEGWILQHPEQWLWIHRRWSKDV